MSAQQTFAFCIDCWEFSYGIADSNGVYTRDSGSSNHWDHAVHVFRDPSEYTPPIRSILRDLHQGQIITDGRMQMFSLALAVDAVQPNNGIKPDSQRAQESDSFVKGQQPSVGTLTTPPTRQPKTIEDAPVDADLFGEPA